MKDITCLCLAFNRHSPKTNTQITAKTTATTSTAKWNKNNHKNQITKALVKTSSLLCERNDLPKNITTTTTLTIKVNLNDFLTDYFKKKKLVQSWMMYFTIMFSSISKSYFTLILCVLMWNMTMMQKIHTLIILIHYIP